MTREETENEVRKIIREAKEKTIDPIQNYMANALSDAFEAGLDAGMKVSKFIDWRKQ